MPCEPTKRQLNSVLGVKCGVFTSFATTDGVAAVDDAGVVIVDTDETGHFIIVADPPGEPKERPSEL